MADEPVNPLDTLPVSQLAKDIPSKAWEEVASTAAKWFEIS